MAKRPPPDDNGRDIPTGRVQRFFRMGRLSSSVSSSYLSQRLRGVFQSEETRSKDLLRTHLRNASRMADTMGNLKGAVMKVGQMISLGDAELLPPAAAEILKVLQAEAPFLPFHRIRERVEEELEGTLGELFAEFDEKPMAAASLGQVHGARLTDGSEVVVKVQYPDIDKTIHSDLSNLKTMLSASGVFGRAFDMEPYFRELEDMLRLELDYVQEAVNIEEMRALLGVHPDLEVPRYVPERSTDRVLTMQRVRGVHLDEFLAAGPDGATRNRAGCALVDLILEGLIVHRVLHADPQLGNFLFQPDGRVAVLDYGCIKRFEEPFIADYRRALRAQLGHDREAVIDAYAAVGYIRPDAGPRTREALWEISEVYARPVSRDRVYTFGSEPLVEMGKNAALKHPACFNMRPPGDVVYLHRTLVGGYFNAAKLGATDNFFQRLKRILDTADDAAGGAPKA
jgi:predicted unusual protein kinase regulating ubiquinone biosynthesis (AarF/ABC1/UbiB family)